MLDLARCLFLDFEARSEANIAKVGARAYAEHPSTKIICCAWAVGDGPVKIWRPGDDIPAEWCQLIWVAQNKDTERFLLSEKLGVHPSPASRWIDLATVASAAGMPRNLHDIAEALHLPVKKQSRAAMLALSKPRRLTKKSAHLSKFIERDERPDLWASTEEYCAGDVEVMREALKALPYELVMPPKEEALAVLTDKMNDLGVRVDLKAVEAADAVVEAHGAELRAEFETLMPGVNPRHPPSVAKALGIDNARKETVRDALKWSTGDHARALTVLKTIKTSSTAKLAAFRRHTCSDGRVHGAMVFHGAGRTGRWSSMGVQLHNLWRGLGAATPDWPAIDSSDDAMDRFFSVLHADLLDITYPDATRAVAAAMRGFIYEPPAPLGAGGLLSGDFAQIEARILVTWARQENAVEAFRRKMDIYKIQASSIYGKPVEQIDANERFMGKRTVLGCGYGVGKDGFQSNLKNDFDIELSLEEADRIVQAYRRANPRVKQLWWDTDALAKRVLLTEAKTWICSTAVPMIAMRMHSEGSRRWLLLRLPSGRCLWYYEPELVDRRIMYWGRDIRFGGRWGRVDTYGGKLVENATQAMARDVLADAMLRLDAAGFAISLQVHDSVTGPGPASELKRFESIMRQPPKWWPDLPIDVDVQHTIRYEG